MLYDPTNNFSIDNSNEPTLVSGNRFAAIFSVSISIIFDAHLDIISTRDADTEPHQPASYNLANSFLPHESPSYIDLLSLTPQEARSLVPSCTARSLEQTSEVLISNGCRRHIVSILRPYPRMMAKSDNLPPFLHPLGCGLHFDHQLPIGNYTAAEFAPLTPLAACISIAPIFNSKTPNSDEFLWRTIESEQRKSPIFRVV